MFGIMFFVTAAAAMSLVWSSLGDGAGNLLLQLRYATASSSQQLTQCPDEESIAPPLPPLDQLIGDFHTKVTGNVSFLLDFAILGHGKCATSAHLLWLRRHPEILMHNREIAALMHGRPAQMVSLLYALPNRPNQKRGYKNPTDIMNPRALERLRTYWPETKFVVGGRHPVKWFESFYNFNKRKTDEARQAGRPGDPLGPAETIGVPDHAYFHAHLSLLGKTNVSDPGELALLGDKSSPLQLPRLNNKVFLYESTQPYDLHSGRNARYRWDLETFLGLTAPLPSIRFIGKVDGETYNYSSPNFHYDIDICEDKYAVLRRQLLEVGTAAAEWILTYFVPHPDVTVSSPEHFEELLRSWSIDPCERK
jgi:hypothetical protein